MARRGGKANTRRSRQRRAGQRPAAPPAPRSVPTPAPDQPTAESGAAPQPDAFEIADAEVRAAASVPRGPTASARRKPPQPGYGSAIGPSRLSANAAAEYHYVVRDLRNIGILVAVMAVLLAIATVAVNLLGIGAG